MPLHEMVVRKFFSLVENLKPVSLRDAIVSLQVVRKHGFCVITLRKELFNKVQLINIVMGCLVYRRLIAWRKPGLPLENTS